MDASLCVSFRVRVPWMLRVILWCIRRLIATRVISLEEGLECGVYVMAYILRVEMKVGADWSPVPWHMRPRPEELIRRAYGEMLR